MYVQVESWANRLHAARIGSYSGWPPLRCVRTASPTSRTIVVQGGLRLLADGDGRLSSRFLSVTLAHVILRLRVAREIIGFLSVTDTYIHTYIHTYIQTISEMRHRISCLALRRSAIKQLCGDLLTDLPTHTHLACDTRICYFPPAHTHQLLVSHAIQAARLTV